MALCGVLALALSWAPAAAAATVEEGKQLFDTLCVACHTIGGGPLSGPDLAGVTERREHDWLVQWISNPNEMLAADDPIATKLLEEWNNVPMTDMGLSEDEAASVVAYLAEADTETAAAPAESQAAAQAPATPEAATSAGDAVVGRNLFTGTTRLANAGPPCLGCHSVAGIGALGGGVLGPDLTQALTKYGGARGLSAFISGTPTPTMNALYADKPLTSEEVADITAFVSAAAVKARPATAVLWLLALAVGGGAVLFALSHLIWRRRLTAVRQPMVANATGRSRPSPHGDQ